MIATTTTKSSKYTPAYTRTDARNISRACLACDSLEQAAELLELEALRVEAACIARNDRTKGGEVAGLAWCKNLRKLAGYLRTGRKGFTIFAKGNSKLPFYSYSELPEFTCPGAGECLRFCYSFTGWRYPAAFCRQLQNTLLMKFRRTAITEAFRKLRKNVTLRLYVDGDFRDMTVLAYWFGLLRQREDIDCYGYSKSWELFDAWRSQGLAWPSNYVLNLSSGSRYDDNAELKGRLADMPITRGEFIAVPLKGTYKKGFARFEDSAYHAEVRQSAREKTGNARVFSCTGKCGECLPNGQHACGLVTLNVPIAIGEHN